MERAAGDCCPTLGHIPPLPGIIARCEAPSMGKSTLSPAASPAPATSQIPPTAVVSGAGRAAGDVPRSRRVANAGPQPGRDVVDRSGEIPGPTALSEKSVDPTGIRIHLKRSGPADGRQPLDRRRSGHRAPIHAQPFVARRDCWRWDPSGIRSNGVRLNDSEPVRLGPRVRPVPTPRTRPCPGTSRPARPRPVGWRRSLRDRPGG